MLKYCEEKAQLRVAHANIEQAQPAQATVGLVPNVAIGLVCYLLDRANQILGNRKPKIDSNEVFFKRRVAEIAEERKSL